MNTDPAAAPAHPPPGGGPPPGRRRRVYGIVYAVLMYIVALVYFAQAVTSGQFLSGTYNALSWHQYAATTTDAVLFCALVAGALLRWHGRGKAWPMLAALGFLLINQAQNLLGASRMVALHIPLGVLMIVGAAVLALFLPHAGDERRAAE